MLHYITTKIWVLGLLLLCIPFFSSAATEYSLQVPTSIYTNQAFSVSWIAADGDNLNQDWVGVFKAGSSDRQYLDWEYTNAQRSGSASLVITEPGTYEIRYLKSGGYVTVATSQTFVVKKSSDGGNNGGGTNADYSLSIANNVSVNQQFTVNFTAPTGDNLNRDWIGVFKAGSNNQQYLDWEYTNGQRSGSVSLTIKESGTYEIRYLKNGGYTAVETSAQFVVGTATGGGTDNGGGTATDYSITVPSSVSLNQSFTVRFTAPTGDNLNRDWIGVFKAGSNNQQYLDWEYTNAQRSGSASLVITEPGTYEIRYLKSGGYVTVATSQTFVVKKSSDGGNNGGGTNADYSLSIANNVSVNQQFTVNFTAPTGDNLNRDWIGVFKAGSNNQQYLDWEYTNGQRSGSVSLTIKESGTYEIRYLKNGGYTAVETSAQFVVGTATGGGTDNGGGTATDYTVTTSKSRYAINETIDATWSTPSGNYGTLDWIGLYTPGASDRNYIEYEYTDTFSKREQFTISNPGTYEFRYFTANSYNRRAVSATFTVGDTGTVNTCNGFNLNNITNLPSQNPNGPIIALGDSITFGLGASPNQDYVEELEKRLNVNIVNAGVPADTTQDVLNRLNRDVLSRQPKTVIIFIGGNDELRRIYEDVRNTAAGRQLRDELDDYVREELNRNWVDVPLLTRNQTTQNLRTIVQRIQATGANTIVVGFDNNIFNDTIYNSYQSVANQTGSIFIPDIYAEIFGRPSRMSDLVHPNDAGYDIVATRIEQGLACII